MNHSWLQFAKKGEVEHGTVLMVVAGKNCHFALALDLMAVTKVGEAGKVGAKGVAGKVGVKRMAGNADAEVVGVTGGAKGVVGNVGANLVVVKMAMARVVEAMLTIEGAEMHLNL